MKNDTGIEIASLMRPSLTHLGIELIDVQWSGAGHGAVLRLVIDRPGGVNLDDCERARRGDRRAHRGGHLMPDPSAAPLLVLHDVAKITALSEAQITQAVEQAVADTYRRLVDDDPEVRARVDLTHSTWRVFRVEGE